MFFKDIIEPLKFEYSSFAFKTAADSESLASCKCFFINIFTIKMSQLNLYTGISFHVWMMGGGWKFGSWHHFCVKKNLKKKQIYFLQKCHNWKSFFG